MRLEQLTYLLGVGHFKSMTLCGEHLHVSQQAISVAIEQLEEEVGVQLVKRTRRGSFLTAEGEEIAAFGKRVFLEWEGLLSKYHQIEGSAYKETALYISPQSRINPDLTSLIVHFRSHAPQMQLSIKSCQDNEIIQNVKANENAVGMLMVLEENMGCIPSELYQYVLSTHQLGLLVNKKSPLAQYSAISLKKLRNLDILVIPEKNASENLLTETIEKYRLEKYNQIIYGAPVEVCGHYIQCDYGVLLGFYAKRGFEEGGSEINQVLPIKEEVRSYTICVSKSEERIKEIQKIFQASLMTSTSTLQGKAEANHL